MTLEEKLLALKQREETAATKRRKVAALIAERDNKATVRAKIMLADAAVSSGFVAEMLGMLPAGEREFVLTTLRLPFSSAAPAGEAS